MTPKDFTIKYIPFAKITEQKTGISAIAILAQCALETGWAKAIVGNMMFGVKDTDGVNGNEQLVTTSEYSSRINCQPKELGLQSIISVKPVTIGGAIKYKYVGKAYFRKYESPEESFTDHANFLLKNKRYATALKVKDNAELFVDAIAKAGYATDPNYSKTLRSIISMIKKYV